MRGALILAGVLLLAALAVPLPAEAASATFEATAYSPGSVVHCHTSGCKPCGPYRDAYHARVTHGDSVTYTWTNPTASGRCPVEGTSIAVDRTLISLGTWTCIGSGIGSRRADDTGGAIIGYRIDIFYDDTGEALNWGRRNVQLSWPGACNTDSTPPGITITDPDANAWVRGVVTVKATVSDPSGILFVALQVDGDAWRYDSIAPHQWSWDTRAEPNGAHTLKVIAEDKAGNRGSKSITSKVDNAPPTTSASLAGTAGLNGWWRSAVSVGLSATDAHSGVQATYRSVDGAAFGAGTTATVSGDGTHTVRYYSTDKVGNTEATKSLTVRIDTTSPSVALTSPLPGHLYVNDMDAPVSGLPETLILGPKTVAASASDATSGMARVEFLIDGAQRASDAGAPYAWLWPSDQEALGDHTVSARAVDQAGNSRSVALVVKTIPSTPQGALATLEELASDLPLP